MVKIGQFIAALRKSKGVTQQEVAKRLGITDKTVSKWECGNGLPDITVIPEIAELFEITADEILRGERIPKMKRSEQKKTAEQAAFFLLNKCKRVKALLYITLAFTVCAFIALYTLLNTTYSGPKSYGASLILCVIGAVLWLFAHNEIGELKQNKIILQYQEEASFSRISKMTTLFRAMFFLTLYVAALSQSLLFHSVTIGGELMPAIARENPLHQLIALAGAAAGLWVYSKMSKKQAAEKEEE